MMQQVTPSLRMSASHICALLLAPAALLPLRLPAEAPVKVVEDDPKSRTLAILVGDLIWA